MSDSLLAAAGCGDLSSIHTLLSAIESNQAISSDQLLKMLSIPKVHLSPCQEKILDYGISPSQRHNHDRDIVLSSLTVLRALLEKDNICSGYAMSLCISVWGWFPFLLSLCNSPTSEGTAAQLEPLESNIRQPRMAIVHCLADLLYTASRYSKEQIISQPDFLPVFLDLWTFEIEESSVSTSRDTLGPLSHLLPTVHTHFGTHFISEIAARNNIVQPFLRSFYRAAEDWSPMHQSSHPVVTYIQIMYDVQALQPTFHRELALRGAVSAILLVIKNLLPLDKQEFMAILPHLQRHAFSSIAYFHQLWLSLVYLGNTLGDNPKERDILMIFVFKEVILGVVERLFVSDTFTFAPKAQLRMVEDSCAAVFDTVASYLVFPKILDHATRFATVARKIEWKPLQRFCARVRERESIMTPILRGLSTTTPEVYKPGTSIFSNAYPFDYGNSRFVQKLVRHDYFFNSALVNQLKLEYKASHPECSATSLVTLMDYTNDLEPFRIVSLDNSEHFSDIEPEMLQSVTAQGLAGKGELVLWHVGRLEDCKAAALEVLTSRDESKWRGKVQPFTYTQFQ